MEPRVVWFEPHVWAMRCLLGTVGMREWLLGDIFLISLCTSCSHDTLHVEPLGGEPESEEKDCRNCKAAAKAVVARPCGHSLYCETCFEQMPPVVLQHCPVCAKPVQGYNDHSAST